MDVANSGFPVTNGACNCEPLPLPTVLRMSQTAANPGRFYYTCPKNKNEGSCGYFCWADQPRPFAQKGKRQAAQPPAATPMFKKAKAQHPILKRSNAMDDITQAAKPAIPQSDFANNLERSCMIINSANAQLLMRALEQNTIQMSALEAELKRCRELKLPSFLQRDRSDSGTQDEDEEDEEMNVTSTPLIPANPTTTTTTTKK